MTHALAISLTIILAACAADSNNDDYPIAPGGNDHGGTGGGSGSGNPPPTPAEPFAATPYTVMWEAGPLLDANGEGTVLVCTPTLCSPLTARTTISAITKMADGRLRFAFSAAGSTTVTYLTSSKPTKVDDTWVATVAAQADGVGARHAFNIVENTDGALSGSIDWDIENVPQAPDDDQFVHFDFVATPQ